MMLLSLCLQQKLDIVAAHVNYHLRKNSDKEEELVRQYCKENQIELVVYESDGICTGNLEAWARKIRYDFYSEVYDYYHCDVLLLGHQLDDHLETYLMMRQRGSSGWYYGIAKSSQNFGMEIYRPLLEIRKKDTALYCEENNVPYAVDESNFSLDYTRNRIRHTIVEPAGDKQIQAWLSEAEKLNQQIKEKTGYIEQNYDLEEVELARFRNEPLEIRHLIIRKMVDNWLIQPLSEAFVAEINRVLMTTDNNGFVSLSLEVGLFHEYGVFYCDKKEEEFSYEYPEPSYEDTPYFSLRKQGSSLEALTVNSSDFPITIRNGKPDDKIEMRFGHKKLNRHFIDRKLKHRERIRTVVVENKENQVIFVEGLGCDIMHYSIKPNLFVVK